MSKYIKQISYSGVMGEIITIVDTESGNSFQDIDGSQNRHYIEYLDWLSKGNNPEVLEV